AFTGKVAPTQASSAGTSTPLTARAKAWRQPRGLWKRRDLWLCMATSGSAAAGPRDPLFAGPKTGPLGKFKQASCLPRQPPVKGQDRAIHHPGKTRLGANEGPPPLPFVIRARAFGL